MSKKNLINILDKADKDLDAFPFWASFKKACSENPIKDLGDNFGFEQSMRNFYSTPNTRVPNDQKAFAEYLYGDMPSCKGGDNLECNKNNYSKYPGY